MGIDVGSTTIKVVVIDDAGKKLYKTYQRHFSDVRETITKLLEEANKKFKDKSFSVAVTGSGGLTLADKLDIPFIQEVIAVKNAIQEVEPKTDVVIELGGEDAKIIFLTNGVEQRMNGICAGGTGAFIDQMAALLQTDASGLNEYAKDYDELYSIAARCGVFAKSDIQPLINDGASKENLSASIFQSVVNQTISGLACGRKIKGRVAFLGGPLTFLSELKAAFVRTLKLKDDEIISPEDSHLFAGYGTALSVEPNNIKLEDLINSLKNMDDSLTETTRLDPVFSGDYEDFVKRQDQYKAEYADLKSYDGKIYLGIDAGSTTSKMVLLSEDNEILYEFYGSNKGNPIEVLKGAFKELKDIKPDIKINHACSTGYGETLLKEAFNLDLGEVETISHYYAAHYFEPEVDSIIDIGGQDMKYIKVNDGVVEDIVLNEACSSGCGSFIESFANSLGYTAEEFAKLSVKSKRPVSLGTRCTVFMNSNVKQAQKEGAAVEDIAQGLAFSVVKNALFKVIKLTDAESLGKHIVCQGGTFYNDTVLKCFEVITGAKVVRPKIAGLMGAFGAALIAKDNGDESQILSLDEIINLEYKTTSTHCKGCINSCKLTINEFSNGNKHVSGNRCEKGLQTGNVKSSDVPNLLEYKKKRIFNYKPIKSDKVIGIPRVLNIYEDYPFWATLFAELGYKVVLSPPSSQRIYELGMDTIPSESECYPAKLAHGHVQWLINKGVKTIFYPCVFYERMEDENLQNKYNCPMVISYPENIKNNVDDLDEKNVKLYNPFVAFTDEKTITDRLVMFFKDEFGIDKKAVKDASHKAWEELIQSRIDVQEEGKRALKWMEDNNKLGIVLAGRPYHVDGEVNHGIPEMIASYGFAVLTEDSVSELGKEKQNLRITNQWMYHSRLYKAANFVVKRDDLNLVQLNSFGCGVDAVTIDQVSEILAAGNKIYTLLKIDEVNNLGAARIRIRSLIAAIRMKAQRQCASTKAYTYERPEYTAEMQEKKYTLLCPNMSPFHFDYLAAVMQGAGYNAVLMKNNTQEAKDKGIKFVNNDVCYPATIITGQIIDEVLSGKYNTDELAVVMSQTGGGCRASNYVGFIRKALIDAGYPNIPVLSLNFNKMETNTGFKISPKLLAKMALASIYGDILMKVTLHTRPYEKKKGETNKLYKKWHDQLVEELKEEKLNFKRFRKNCTNIIREFDAIPVTDEQKPVVGIVGEILVKYMPFANNNLAELLEREGCEVIVPDFVGFFEFSFLDNFYKRKYLGGRKRSSALGWGALRGIKFLQKPIDKELEKSTHFHKKHDIRDIQRHASKVMQTGNQSGEGWFLSGEIINLIDNGTNNIVCVQPFGCLPNHVVGKGIFKKVKELYPQANLVAVDYDPSASAVNQLNRIKLMLENA
ncbi:MAG: acyl-CoA dehydratase activase-related protein [Coriobacteriia bacterium]|nr:acyl-CoA dehydratase activase-related protein [Coriobacteriia bacterium]